MIPAAATLSIAWLDVDELDPGAQAINLDAVAFFARIMAGPGEPHLAPVTVSPTDDGRFRIRDGRHRWHAHRVLGRTRIRCVVVEPEPVTLSA